MAAAQRALAGASLLAVTVALAPMRVTAAPAPASRPEPAPASPAASMQPAPPAGATTTPGPQSGDSQEPARRWQIRQAPLAGAESSWGPPGGQMPEYAEFTEPQATQGPPPRGTPRIVSGAILGPLGLGLAIAGIVGATTDVLGDQKRLSVPMVGFGIVASAIGWGLFADGILRRKKFTRWQAKGGQVAVAPMLVPGRLAGVSLGLRF